MHSGYNSYGANSGRFTSSGSKRVTGNKKKESWGINIQQVPRDKEFRECFVPSKGFKFVIADYSQIELRLAAELIGIPQMIEAFQNGADLHSLTASLIYHVPIDEVEKSQRQMGKTLNFALLYGMGFKNTKHMLLVQVTSFHYLKLRWLTQVSTVLTLDSRNGTENETLWSRTVGLM